MIDKKIAVSLSCALLFFLIGCSRQQSDWQKAREANTTDSYEQFLKKYPSGEFTAQAQARVKESYEERDWQKARDADTPEAYQTFLKQYPEGKWTEEARIRVENFTLAQAPGVVSKPAVDTAVVSMPPVSLPKEPEAARAKARSGSFGVQLGAFKSGATAAHQRWAHLRQEYPSLLSGLSSQVTHGKAAAGSVYRLQATGLTEQHARTLCKDLKAKSQSCVVVPPAHAG